MSKKIITPETMDQIGTTLKAKGLAEDMVPAEFAEEHNLKSRDIADLSETKGQSLLTWLNEIPDDQPVDTAPGSGALEAGNETTDDVDQAQKDDVRKAEDILMIKRALNADEQQENMSALFELAARRTTLEFELDGFKNQVKGCQKEIEGIDLRTYRLIREMEENEIEESVEALRVTNHSEGMIYWYHRDSGELLREKPIEMGEQLPLDLAGDASAHSEAKEEPSLETELSEDQNIIPASDSFTEPDQMEAQT